KLTFQKPLKLAADIRIGDDVNHVVVDGANVYADSSRDKTTYLKHPITSFKDAISELARAGGAGVGLLPILLTDENAASRIVPGAPTSMRVGADETVGGDACDVVVALIGAGDYASRVSFAIGKQDHLLRRVTLVRAMGSEKPAILATHSNVTV